jgi:acyl-homoserine-lactone acylase
MRKLLLAVILLAPACAQPGDPSAEVAAWESRAEKVTIIRDDWGVPHIY